MKDRSQVAMIVGLAALAVVVMFLSPSFTFISILGGMRGALPWILMGLAFWFIFGKGGGCCGKSSSKES